MTYRKTFSYLLAFAFISGHFSCSKEKISPEIIASKEPEEQIFDVIKLGDITWLETLLDENPGLLETLDWGNSTPLHLAAHYNKLEAAELLILRGANVNAKDRDGNTPLHNASLLANIEMCGLLLEKGAEVNARNEDGSTPLHLATFGFSEKHVLIVSLLLDYGADVALYDNEGITPLHFASMGMGQSTDIVKLLIENGADLNDKDNIYEQYPLHVASEGGNTDICELLLANGAKTDIFIEAALGREEMVKKLIYENPNLVNARDYLEDTPLHWAVETGQKEVACLLITNGADVNARNKNGTTPLKRAIKLDNTDLAELLIENGGIE
jgi:ankyrin repeat protein